VLESDSDDIAHGDSHECEDDGDAKAAEKDVEQTTAAVEKKPEPAEIVEPLIVYFDVNRDDLNAGARAEVTAYVEALKATSPSSVNVVGYTDTSGSPELNARLSEARANSVSAALIDAGLSSGSITRSASGESDLAVDTPDGTREANNRRVTVTPAY